MLVLLFCLFFLQLPQVELYSNNTWTSTYGWPLVICNWEHHGGVWWIVRSTSNVHTIDFKIIALVKENVCRYVHVFYYFDQE